MATSVQTDLSLGLDITRRFVRITKERKNDFIEFDYAIGEPEIFLELVLPREAFLDFCVVNKVELLPSTQIGSKATKDWGWRISDATNFD
ncbi:MAG: phenol hydroxylase [Colwellia sp.]|nr:MAG: phenol hydroxylase [Colwellia sp.]